MPRRVENHIEMEGAELLYPNFTGKEGLYNKEGDRNFCVLLTEELAADLIADGWNVKRQRAEGDPEKGIRTGPPYLQVAVGYGKGRPPIIELFTQDRSRGTALTENEVEMLDWIEIESIDVIIRPYNWAVRDDHGVKAYLKELYVTQRESVFRRKYADVPRIGRGQTPLEIADAPYEDDIVDAEEVQEVDLLEIEGGAD